ncbi:MAG: hypothetical protein HJJLKODD_00800 [Phycisphaerae bacterium]|nr:hypothetical protein [Phycisphaerae bacterium]
MLLPSAGDTPVDDTPPMIQNDNQNDPVVVPNQPPTATAGADQVVDSGQLVLLDGAASNDPDGDALQYAWAIADGLFIPLEPVDQSHTEFIAPPVQHESTVRITLTVSDGQYTDHDELIITILPPSPDSPPATPAPHADAGPDLQVQADELVLLDGSLSASATDAPLEYEWSQLSGPAVALSDATQAVASFTAPYRTTEQQLIFALRVRVGELSAEDLVQVTVFAGTPAGNPPPAGGGGPPGGVGTPPDGCPADPDKTEPGDCGCGTPDEDLNHNGISDCLESYLISGQVTLNGSGLAGVTLNGLPGNPQSSANGQYLAEVPADWSGVVMPQKNGFLFTPAQRTYSHTSGDRAQQDFSAMQAADSITQYGITWTFDQRYPVGQFATGDWWVVGPVTIASVSPSPAGTGLSFRNGSMINPDLANNGVQSTYHAYDGRADGFNAAYQVSYPLTLDPTTGTKSLISTVSVTAYPVATATDPERFPDAYRSIASSLTRPDDGTLLSAAILTVVSSPPPEDAFRPPFVGTAKPLFTVASLRTELLPNLPVAPNAPSLATLERCLHRPWIDAQKRNWMAMQIAPIRNQVSYGREFAMFIGDAALSLCLDYTAQQKRKIMIGLVQMGIDHYYAAQLDPGLWIPSGGYRHGRKLPVLIAGLLLNHAGMMQVQADFAEDLGTYYGDEQNPPQTLWTGWAAQPRPYANTRSNNVLGILDVGLDNQGNPYDFEHVHPREWDQPPFPNNGYYPFDKHDPYRRLVAYSWIGEALAARILGLQEEWNHDAFFDYVDRWMHEDDSVNRQVMADTAVQDNWIGLVPGTDWTDIDTYYPPGRLCYSQFQNYMYLTYRADY